MKTQTTQTQPETQRCEYQVNQKGYPHGERCWRTGKVQMTHTTFNGTVERKFVCGTHQRTCQREYWTVEEK
jgi:hypothetical protein